jgi:tetratricopeptide (TPR) repeat protein
MAIRLAPRDEWAHFFMGSAYSLAGRLEDAIAECQWALELNPNFSIAYADLGEYFAFLGRPQEAIEYCRVALRLNPRDPSNFWRYSSIATAHFVAGDYTAALQEAKRLTRLKSDFLRAPILWAAAATAIDRTDEAEAALTRCLAVNPSLRIGDVVPRYMTRFAREEDHERLMAMLRKAGLTE